MLKTRVLTAIVGVIVVIAAITIGPSTFSTLLMLLGLVAWWEFNKIGKQLNVVEIPGWGYVSNLLIFIGLYYGGPYWAMVVAMLAIFYALVSTTFSKKQNLVSLGYSIFGLLYIGGGFASLYVLRLDSFYNGHFALSYSAYIGQIMIWLIILCTWASDTFAYFVGRFLGRHHIVAAISPKKTLEGYIGGFLACVVLSVVYGWGFNMPLYLALPIGLIVGITAPLGDLFESKLKRLAGIKDSGKLLPGHGGVLDRFDSLFFVAPFVLLYLLYF